MLNFTAQFHDIFFSSPGIPDSEAHLHFIGRRELVEVYDPDEVMKGSLAVALLNRRLELEEEDLMCFMDPTLFGFYEANVCVDQEKAMKLLLSPQRSPEWTKVSRLMS